jgi:hypothetical protein
MGCSFIKHIKALVILTVGTVIFKSFRVHSYRRFFARKLRHWAQGSCTPLSIVVSTEGDIVQQETLWSLTSNNPTYLKRQKQKTP